MKTKETSYGKNFFFLKVKENLKLSDLVVKLDVIQSRNKSWIFFLVRKILLDVLEIIHGIRSFTCLKVKYNEKNINYNRTFHSFEKCKSSVDNTAWKDNTAYVLYKYSESATVLCDSETLRRICERMAGFHIDPC